MIELAFPWALLALPLPWFVWRFVPPYRHRVSALRFPFFQRIAEAAEADPQQGAVISKANRFEATLAIIIWLLLVLALARPERVGEPIEIVKAARDMILAIDISGSMDERDFKATDGRPSQRLATVKNVVGRFVEARSGDRIALIIFGSKAFVQAPFTEDLRTVRDLLEETKVGMAGPHTVIGDAIGLGIRTFESSEIENRLMILLSDGEDTGSRMSPINAAEIAAQNGVEIFTIGVGDPAGLGNNRIDTEMLMQIAERTGGRYFFAGNEGALEVIYNRINLLAPRKVETLTYRPREPMGHFPVGVALLLGVSLLMIAARNSAVRMAR